VDGITSSFAQIFEFPQLYAQSALYATTVTLQTFALGFFSQGAYWDPPTPDAFETADCTRAAERLAAKMPLQADHARIVKV
jgi:hypothetical protein